MQCTYTRSPMYSVHIHEHVGYVVESWFVNLRDLS